MKENAAKRPDIIKIWVDDRDNTVPKLTPALYGAIIDEAHKQNIRVTAHIFDLEDGKGLLKANVDAFAHSVRDRDVDEEFMTMVEAAAESSRSIRTCRRAGKKWDTVLASGENPGRGVRRRQKGNVDNAKQAEAFGIQARNLKRLNDARYAHRARHGRQHAVGAAPGDGETWRWPE